MKKYILLFLLILFVSSIPQIFYKNEGNSTSVGRTKHWKIYRAKPLDYTQDIIATATYICTVKSPTKPMIKYPIDSLNLSS